MHNRKPTVSVIIPAHNSAKYIGEAIGSVLAQTYPVHEIIVIDDGSSDNTEEVMGGYVKSAVVKYIRRPNNKGPAAARNAGIRVAIGDYIAFLDSDDVWLPEKTEKQILKLVDMPEYVFVHTERLRINLSGDRIGAKKIYSPEGEILNDLLMYNFICTSSVLARKSCFEDVGVFDESKDLCEDYEMWLRIAAKYKMCYVDEPLVKYRINPKGYSRTDIGISCEREWNTFLKALPLYEGDKKKLSRIRSNRLMYRLGDDYFYHRNYQRASEAFLRAVKKDWLDYRSLLFCIVSNIIGFLKIRTDRCL